MREYLIAFAIKAAVCLVFVTTYQIMGVELICDGPTDPESGFSRCRLN